MDPRDSSEHDAAHVVIGTELLIFVGKILVRVFTKGGQGYAERVLPDADPQQRRDLEHAGTADKPHSAA
ncbi:hypothetical protein ACFUGD_03485 [Streptomyces sp. NPDC057217]|uniref:hypothetical protein n=1 Tax=Streptomyces sp. NPDC057217 TaxID=3346054 RepID=UPI003627FB89